MASTRKTMRKMPKELGGFTIIEVILVLAIAGLIFLMVFIALPTLNRSQRDSKRQRDMGTVANAITKYQQNNNGKLPTAPSKVDATESEALPECSTTSTSSAKSAQCFIRNYLNAVNATENEFQDPSGWYYGIDFQILSNGDADMGAGEFDEHIIYVYEHGECDGETAKYSPNARDYAVVYKFEGSGTYCNDNK